MANLVIKPADGGQLITRTAQSDPGPANYTVKRNWRRDLEAEVQREGFSPFCPDPSANDAADQARPTTFPITLIKRVLWQNGDSSTIVGSATTLMILAAPGSYVASGYVASGYVADSLRWNVIGSGFSPNGRRWQSEMVNGKLWLNNDADLPVTYSRGDASVEPCYELRDQGVASVRVISTVGPVPICLGTRELAGGDPTQDAVTGLIQSPTVTVSQTGAKFSGSAMFGMTVTGGGALGTVTASRSFFGIGDINKVLFLGDGQAATIAAYTSPTVVSVAAIGGVMLTPISTNRPDGYVSTPYNPSSPGVDAWSLIATGPFFTPAMVGSKISFGSQIRTITAYHSPAHVKVDSQIPGAPGQPRVSNPQAYLRLDQMSVLPASEARDDRALWGNTGNATDFAAGIPAAGVAGSRILHLGREARSFKVGDEVVVEGGGLEAGNLVVDQLDNPVTILAAGPGLIELSTPVRTGGSLRLLHASALGSIVGYEDLEDEGGAVVAAAKISDVTVIHKDRSIFMAAYSGDAARPIVFRRVIVPHDRTIHFRNCGVTINDESHIFPGRNAFWSFDPATLKLRGILGADLVENTFFGFATAAATEDIFSADNAVTQEVWWFNAQNPTDPILCFDYRWSTFSTADLKGFLHSNGNAMQSVTVTAAASLQGPSAYAGGETETWFVMGCSDGRLLTYGAVTGIAGGAPNWPSRSVYYRQPTTDAATRSGYDCVLASGLSNFKDEINQKQFQGYLIQFGDQVSDTPAVNIQFWTARNQAAGQVMAGQKTIADAVRHGFVPIHFMAHNMKDVVTARTLQSTAKPLRLLHRAWTLINTGDQSEDRR